MSVERVPVPFVPVRSAWAWAPALMAGAVIVLFYLKVLSSHAWDPRAFVLERPPGLPREQRWGVGYDGQFAYALAVNPLGSSVGLDQPAYRSQRIVYPLIVRLLSLGQATWVPWVMLLVNLLATTWGCFVLGELLARRGAARGWALVFVFSFAYLLSVRLDLLEPLTFALALTGWLAYERDRPVWAIGLFALSGLTKEVGLIFPIALAAWEFLRGRWRRSIAVALGSGAPYVIWYLVLYQAFGRSAAAAVQSSLLPIPFIGLLYVTDAIQIGFISALVLLPAWCGGVCAAWFAWRQRAGERGRDAVLVVAHAALVASMPLPTWEDPLAVARIGLGLVAALLLWLAAAHRRALPLVALLWAPSGFILALVPGML